MLTFTAPRGWKYLTAMCIRSLPLPTLLCLFVCCSYPANKAAGQALEELKLSEAYRKLEFDQPLPPKGAQRKGSKPHEVLTNYDSLWSSSRGSRLLLQWIEARVPNYRLEILAAGYRKDHAGVDAVFQSRQKVKVAMTIQVPMPQYKTMAQHQTLASFNRYRPPLLDIVGSQKIELHGVQADYFRHSDGSCSVLIPTEQLGIINLIVSSCTESATMFEVAKLLNVARLNQKLTS
jgi:hypothetical protein